jgi:hypothetical protein
MTELKRYDIHYDYDDGYLERSYCNDGDHIDAYEALDVIEKLELAVERATANMIAAQNRVAELEEALRQIRCKEVLSCDIGLQDFCDRALGGKG